MMQILVRETLEKSQGILFVKSLLTLDVVKIKIVAIVLNIFIDGLEMPVISFCFILDNQGQRL